MANIPARDGAGNAIQIFAVGTGTALDPYRYTSEGFLPFVWRATVAGTGYAIGDRLVLKQESNEAFQWYRINSTGSVAALGNTNVPATSREEISGATSGATSDATTPTIRFATFRAELTPQTFPLTNCKMIAIVNQSLQTLRYAFAANDTINNPNHSLISSVQPELAIDKISRTGILEICAETVPSPVVVNNCSTTAGSTTVTGTGLNNIYVGQSVSGVGIPVNTYVSSLNIARTQLTLCSENGTSVNATATGSVTLTFSGAVIRLTIWS